MKIAIIAGTKVALERHHGYVDILALDTLVARGGWRGPLRPTVVLGYSRELISHTGVIGGVPHLFGRQIAGAVNDRFLYNLTAVHGPLDADSFLPANRCYEAGADKALATAYLRRLVSP